MKITRYLIGLIGGATFGMLFAPKKGAELRKEFVDSIKESNSEGARTLFKAFRGAGREVAKEVKHITNSKEMQEFIHYGEERIYDILALAQDRGVEFTSMAQEKLEQLSELAAKKAQEIGEMGTKNAHTMKEEIVSKVKGTVGEAKNTAFHTKAIKRMKRIQKKVMGD